MKRHDSMRGWFVYELHKLMKNRQDVVVLTGDLGFGMLDAIRNDYKDRFINVGAAEQTLVDVAIGLSLSGKTPVVYSITTFLVYRPFEALRTYVNHERIKMLLVGGGRDKDYAHDGISHWAEDVKDILTSLKNIKQYYPKEKEELPALLPKLIDSTEPIFLSLKR